MAAVIRLQRRGRLQGFYSISLLGVLQFLVITSRHVAPTDAIKFHTNGMPQVHRSIASTGQLPEKHEMLMLRDLLQEVEKGVTELAKDKDESQEAQKVENIEKLPRLDDDKSDKHPNVEREKVEGVEQLKRPDEEKSNEHSKAAQQASTAKQEQGEKPEVEPQKPSDDQQDWEPFVIPEPYFIGSSIKDWDEQRKTWLESHPHMKAMPDGKPRVLIVTGSTPKPCHSPIGDHFHVKSFKLKIDYARIHNYDLYYCMSWLDPLLGGEWVKLPNVRKLMLTHPEIEWIMWVDSDAVFTDMLFEAPFHEYEGFNMIMWGWEDGFYKQMSWTAFNAGVFIMRNCQWSLDLFEKWAPMGLSGKVRDEFGKKLSAFYSNRGEDLPADDQSALGYLMHTDQTVRSKIKLVDSEAYAVSMWWVPVVPTYEELMKKYHPGLGDMRWPWITHFTGCGPCGGSSNAEYSTYEECMTGFDRAYNFADNQVLAFMGFQHESLFSHEVVRTRNETDRLSSFVGVNPWKERVAAVTGNS